MSQLVSDTGGGSVIAAFVPTVFNRTVLPDWLTPSEKAALAVLSLVRSLDLSINARAGFMDTRPGEPNLEIQNGKIA